jgi:hypothetical protein
MPSPADEVLHFLVTTDNRAERVSFSLHTAAITVWVEGRENRHGTETWLVAVLPRYRERFLNVARRNRHITVEEIYFEGDQERYRLHVGEEDTGWWA